MMELSGVPVAEGWWCTQCETYEYDDDVIAEQDTCDLCGHNGAQHIRVEVVAK